MQVLSSDGIARNYFFSSHINLKASLVQRCFLCFHCLFAPHPPTLRSSVVAINLTIISELELIRESWYPF